MIAPVVVIAPCLNPMIIVSVVHICINASGASTYRLNNMISAR